MADNIGRMGASAEAVDLNRAAAVCEILEQAAQANFDTPARSGSVVDLGGEGQLVISGDLHDQREHFDRIIRLAQLGESENNHVVLQEIIHGERLINGMDLSYRLITRAAELKVQRPAQVHVILSNHELAQSDGDGIMKEGVSVLETFDRGIEYVFGEECDAVAAAIRTFVRSMPLAVRCANGILCAHSLPAPRKTSIFDPAVLDRRMTDADYANPDGSAYLMVWGRGLTQKSADELAAKWGVKQFVLGHQHADMGWDEIGETILILNSDHARGVALPIDLAKAYTHDELVELMLPLAAL